MARKAARAQSRRQRNSQGELRIIGGDWRSRKLYFPEAGGVRPTPARARETLFNWLNFHLAGASCLDLFAGSGALGLEALSRGAASVTLVDHTPALVRALQENLRLLGCSHGEVICMDAEQFLKRRQRPPFDIVFMDPPFRQGWLERLIFLLHAGQWIRDGGWIYMEFESERTPPVVPDNWQPHRQSRAGQVTYALYRVGAGAA